MARGTSCGTLIVNERGELLLCHVTGQRQWDIPKGGAEPGEAPLAAAVRETAEETGITLEPARLLDLGLFAYRPEKDLHLFMAPVRAAEVELAACRCTSLFTDRRGRSVPEVDAFRWAALDGVARLCTPRMAGVIARAAGPFVCRERT